jgi:hypothetical protein
VATKAAEATVGSSNIGLVDGDERLQVGVDLFADLLNLLEGDQGSLRNLQLLIPIK